MITKRKKRGKRGSRLKKVAFYGLMVMIVATGLFLGNTGHEFMVYGVNSSDLGQGRQIEAVLTAYSSEESQTDSDPYIMASGKKVYDGAVACPRKYEFGWKVVIDGRTYICEDRKNIRYESYTEKWIDVWFPTTEEALEFGIKKQVVIIYE